jgi:hypothetical protein
MELTNESNEFGIMCCTQGNNLDTCMTKWWQDDMLKARSKHVGILQSGHKRENMIAKYIIRATSPCDYTKCYICSNVGVNELLSMLPLFIFV